jgi:hypothetical protein
MVIISIVVNTARVKNTHNRESKNGSEKTGGGGREAIKR